MFVSRAIAVVGVLCAPISFSNHALGQQTLLGKWSGTYAVEGARNNISVGIELSVDSVDGAKATGTWVLLGGICQGEYPFTGTFRNNRLKIRTEPGAKMGCGPYGPSFDLQGEELAGNFAKQAVTLKK